MTTLVSIYHAGVAFRRGAARGRYTLRYEVPASTVVDYVEDGEPRSLAFSGDLSVQSALDETRLRLPGIDCSRFISDFNSKAASPLWHLA